MARFFLFGVILGAVLTLWRYLPKEIKGEIRQHAGKAFWPIILGAVIAILLLFLALTTTIRVI